MFIEILDQLYLFLPPRLRYGPEFTKTYNLIQRAQYWNKEEIEAYQLEQLRLLIASAILHCPYYRELFAKLRLTPTDFKTLEHLKLLPFLTKDQIKTKGSAFISSQYRLKALKRIATGGTTGSPLNLYIVRAVQEARDWAYMLSQLEMAGVNYKERAVLIRERHFEGSKGSSYYKYDRINKKLYLSPFQLKRGMIKTYLEKIIDFSPKYIQAYPSVLITLAREMKMLGKRPIQGLKAVICDSENLYTWQRDLLEGLFQVKVYDFYGHAERAVTACQCTEGSFYHLMPTYGIVEYLPLKGKHCSETESLQELVVTGLTNHAFPLIRYRTGDYVVQARGECACGRGGQLFAQIKGRQEQFLYTRHSQPVALTGIYGLTAKVFSYDHDVQYYQERAGQVIIRIACPEANITRASSQLLESLNQRFDGEIEFNVEAVKDAQIQGGGKKRLVDQKLQL